MQQPFGDLGKPRRQARRCLSRWRVFAYWSRMRTGLASEDGVIRTDRPRRIWCAMRWRTLSWRFAV
jgi:hypothetical protein